MRIARKGLVNRASRLGVDARLQLPAFAARRQFADQREHVVAILFMRAGQESETAIVLDDAVVILGKTELRQRVVERATRRDEERRDMQPSTALRRILLGHDCSSRKKPVSGLSI